MSVPLLATASNGQPMHFSVGAIIERDGKYLMVDRVKEPFGWACLAGHVDEGETQEEALIREISEESGLVITSSKLLIEEEVLWNDCGYAPVHYWYVYRCDTIGQPIIEKDGAKGMGWFTAEELKSMNLEPVWSHWLERLDIL